MALEDFVKVATVGDIASGEMKRVEAGGEQILLANVDGTYHAVGDECTHEYASLSEGELAGETVECPLHSSQFSVRTGKVEFPPADEDLPVYSVRVEGDDILVGPRRS